MRRRERGLNLHELMITVAILVVLFAVFVATVITRGYSLWYLLVPPGLIAAYFLAMLTWVELESRRKKRTE